MGYLQLNSSDAALVNGAAAVSFSVIATGAGGTLSSLQGQTVGNGSISWSNAHNSDSQHATADGDCHLTVDWGPLVTALAGHTVDFVSATIETFSRYPSTNGTANLNWNSWPTFTNTQIQQIQTHVIGNGSNPQLDEGTLRTAIVSARGSLRADNSQGTLGFALTSTKSWGCRPLPID